MIEINVSTKEKVDKKKIVKAVEGVFEYLKEKKRDVSIAFVGEKRIKAINKSYRKKDYITDILAFNDEDGGELIVCLKQIKRQAKLYKNSEQEELQYILIHGTLHLLGFSDKTEKGRLKMEKLGDKIFYVKNKKTD